MSAVEYAIAKLNFDGTGEFLPQQHTGNVKKVHCAGDTETADPCCPDRITKEIQEKLLLQGDNVSVDDSITTIQDSQLSPKFNNIFCGEPFKPQRLKLDFTPIPSVDDDEQLVQECTNFWNFVYSQPQLLAIMADVETKDTYTESSMTSTTYSSVKTAVLGSNHASIDWMEKLPFSVVVQQPERYCLSPPLDYWSRASQPSTSEKISFKPSQGVLDSAFGRTKICKPCEPHYNFKSKSVDETKKLCQEMEDFDRKHPKSFDRPGMPPEQIPSLRRLPCKPNCYGANK